MRLWSIDFSYLDSKGLVALWREALLAQAVIYGKTNGYKSHPQLDRFKNNKHLLYKYLCDIIKESIKRGFNFNESKIIKPKVNIQQKYCNYINIGQLIYEFNHLQNKLEKRDLRQYFKNEKVNKIKGCKLFTIDYRQTNPNDWEKL